MSKVYVLSHGTSDPDYGFQRDSVRAFSSRDKARKVLAEMLKHDVEYMADDYDENEYAKDLSKLIDEPDKYFIESFNYDAFKAFIEEITLE